METDGLVSFFHVILVEHILQYSQSVYCSGQFFSQPQIITLFHKVRWRMTDWFPFFMSYLSSTSYSAVSVSIVLVSHKVTGFVIS